MDLTKGGLHHLLLSDDDNVAESNIDNNLLVSITRDLIENNHLCREFNFIANNVSIASNEEIINGIALLNTQVHNYEVSAITAENNPRNIVKSIRLTLPDKTSNIIKQNSALFEPLCYPMLFNTGENGWNYDLGKKFSFSKYLISRILQPDHIYNNFDDEKGDFLIGHFSKYNESNFFPSNRFQLLYRIGQTYIVDMSSTLIDSRMDYQKDNQKMILGTDHAMDNDGNDNDENDENDENDDNDDDDDSDNDERDKKVFLSESLHGSRRHLKKKQLNSLALIAEYGKPHMFLTLTCNPKWPELGDALPHGQTAYDNPVITNMVFKKRLDALLYNIRHGKYFGQRKTVYEMHCIEYQHRGLPHSHVVFRLDDMVADDDMDGMIDFIDEWMCCSYPIDDADHTKAIKDYMIHNHCDGVNGCRRGNGTCKRGYDNVSVQDRTTINSKGYPVYKRNTDNDLMVVPHVRDILIDWDGHACMEFAATTRTILYLYKYLYKGQKKVKVNIHNNDSNQNEDITKNEILLYLYGRKICAHDAVWRLLGFHTYPRSFPGVKPIKPRNESFIYSNRKNGKTCDLDMYFNRPQGIEYDDLTFKEFFKKFIIYPTNQRNSTELLLPLGCNSKKYLKKRSPKLISIVRITSVSLKSGELWYFRTILLRKAIRSFKDAKTFNGTEYTTFQECAIQMGILSNYEEAIDCFMEAKNNGASSIQLRSLFVMLTSEGYSTLYIIKNDEYKVFMSEDYILMHPNYSNGQIFNMLLQDIEQRLKLLGKQMEDYGFQSTGRKLSELHIMKLKYPRDEQLVKYHESMHQTPPNNEQQIIMNDIIGSAMNMRQNDKGKLILLLAQGGSGKTTIAKIIIEYLRSQGKIVCVCASTAIAALNFKNDGMTAHNLFNFPVTDDIDRNIDDEKSECNMSKERLELLMNTNVIVWDEFLNNNKEIFEAAYSKFDGFRGMHTSIN